MTEGMTLDDMKDASPYMLADMAQCGAPDSPSSAGAKFLDSVRDAVVEMIESGSITLDDFNNDGQLSDIADDAPSIYTHARWQQFVDLGAYHEEPEFDDAWPKDLNQAAAVALYQVADRLGHALCEAWRQGWACPVCEDDADSGCTPDGCANPAGALVGLVRERLADQAGNGPEANAEPLPVRTRGHALGMALAADTDVYTAHVDLSIVDQAEASDMGRRVARAALAHDTRVRRFRRRVILVTGTLALVVTAVGALVAGGVL